jgi:iron complex transport system substrate-binding protein
LKPIAILACLIAGALSCSPAFALPRVVSLSVCADQYVLALADPAQIVALSLTARDPAMSFYARRAAAYPLIGLHAEEILALHPDLVVTDDYSDASTLRLLARIGIHTVLVPDVESFNDLQSALRAMGDALGRHDAGEAAAATLSARVAALEAAEPVNPPPVLYLLPTGATAGPGTYIDETLRLAGFANDATRRGITGWHRLSLEELIADPPGAAIVSFFIDPLASTGTIMGTNPTAQRIAALAHPIAVPNALWPCGGPMLIEAAEFLRKARMAMP